MVKKEAEKILKWKDLTIEIQHVCNAKNESGTSRRATGTISKSFRKYLSNVAGNHDIHRLQITAVLGTCPHVSGSINVKVGNYIVVNNGNNMVDL